MKNAVRLRRLERLLKVLAKIPAHDFDMDFWGTRTKACGTHACLLGHAAMDASFKRQGLKGFWKPDWRGGPMEELVIKYRGAIHQGAGLKFFGLSTQESDLFVATTHTRGVAAKREKRAEIKALIKHYRDHPAAT